MKKQLLSASLALLAMSQAAKAQNMVGITGSNSVFTMANVNSPSTVSGPYTVSGVASGQVLVAIDYRASNGKLYAIGYDSVASSAQLYTISNSGTTYTATAVGAASPSIHLGSTTNASMDFISTTDEMVRVVGRNGNSYLLNADNGTIALTGTGAFNFALGDAHAAAANTMAGIAYSNSFYGSDATTMYGYDAMNNVLVSFNAGSYLNGFNNEQYIMHSEGLTTGALISSGSSVGMDAWYDTATNSNTLYMSASTILGAHLYKYNMGSGAGTGTMTDLGVVGSGSMSVKDIAFPTYRADSTAAVTGKLMAGLSLNMRNLVWFDSYNPGNIRRQVRLHGLATGQSMVAIDYSADGSLYGLGYNSIGHTYQLYKIDSASGNVMAINPTAISLDLGNDDGSGNHVNAGFRFITTASNQIRLTGNNGATNVRLDATTGAIIATDTALTYVTGDSNFGASANITSIAYTGYTGDTTTQMFGFDANTGAMVKFNTADGTMGFGNGSSGYINTDMSLSSVLSLFLFNSTYNNSHMGITYDNATSANVGYMASNYYGDSSIQNNYSVLYDMSAMLSGYHKGTASTPSRTGKVGYGTPVKDIAVKRSALGTTPSGVASVGTTNALLVYPNPVAAVTRITLPAAAVGTLYIDVVDMAGHVYHTAQDAKGMTSVDFDMSTYAPGSYTLNVYSLDGVVNHVRVTKL